MKTTNENQGVRHDRGVCKVRVEFSDPEAERVAVVGTFNDWRPGASPMVPMGGGRWVKEMVLPPGRYEYLLVVDGEWRVNPLAQETVPSLEGGAKCVLRAGNGRA